MRDRAAWIIVLRVLREGEFTGQRGDECQAPDKRPADSEHPIPYAYDASQFHFYIRYANTLFIL
jgi:hypothetical protein